MSRCLWVGCRQVTQLPLPLLRAGLEFAGTVLEVLPEATDPAHSNKQQQQQQAFSLKPGDRVLGVLRFGAFASHVVLPAAYLRPVPQHWTFEQVRFLQSDRPCQGQHSPLPQHCVCVSHLLTAVSTHPHHVKWKLTPSPLPPRACPCL